jgi:hypothetical protein
VPVLPLPARRDPLARNAGWEELAREAGKARDEPGRVSWIGADRYQDVSELAYHSRPRASDAPRNLAFCMCLGGRHNQYELWPTFPMTAKRGEALVLVLDDTPPDVVHITAEMLAPYFETVRRGALAPLRRGADTVSVRRIWVLEGYRGGWPARAEP